MSKTKLDMTNMLGDPKTLKVVAALEGGLNAKQDLNQVLTEVGITTRQLAPEDLIPRKKNRPLDEEKVESLMRSIREIGVLEDLIARPHPEISDKYELLGGNHRRESCLRLGKLAPTKIVHVDDLLAVKIAGATNALRNQLNALEEADMVIEVLSLELKMPEPDVEALFWQHSNKTIDPNSFQWRTIEAIVPTVTAVAISSFTRHYLPLRKLPQDLLDSVRSGKLHYTKAEKLIPLKHPRFESERRLLLQEAIVHNLSTTELLERVNQLLINSSSIKQQKPEPLRKMLTRRVKSVQQRINQIKNWDSASQKEVEKLLNKLELKIQELSERQSTN
ncbi:ParB N-terminal domain-containing protein [Chroococcidiopsis sp. FACHB-1243]|uniref:ParB/RepB/Spo0J family partition protein n=1 Tax=Chroococcidiopsis sp. [FACHB-1243] TaxID=2692781 RepID=UPI00177B7C71|nr:ParB N-terminal domain-containing protein [Chroococcidiopsis sp. [FACHB-1243]]MBD2309992.1 ParB N-terminal domain-containing protein [Chroococcidiopsis sp. [FACHB-1243]]